MGTCTSCFCKKGLVVQKVELVALERWAGVEDEEDGDVDGKRLEEVVDGIEMEPKFRIYRGDFQLLVLLPAELVRIICSFLDWSSLLHLEQTSKQFRLQISSDFVWRSLLVKIAPKRFDSKSFPPPKAEGSTWKKIFFLCFLPVVSLFDLFHILDHSCFFKERD